MTPCTSSRGKWSTPGRKPNRCPACGGAMPYKPEPMTSWQASRQIDASRASNTQPKVMRMFAIKRRKAA